jgi:hypothetical protein
MKRAQGDPDAAGASRRMLGVVLVVLAEAMMVETTECTRKTREKSNTCRGLSST